MTCQVGAEAALKREVSQLAPYLKFAFSRPGFLTFKDSTGNGLTLDTSLPLVFARSHGLSLGKVKSADPAQVVSQCLIRFEELKNLAPSASLHFWQRDLYAPREWPKGIEPGVLPSGAQGIYDALVSSGEFNQSGSGNPGALFYDVVMVDADEFWLGAHRGTHPASKWPGGRPPLRLSDEVPSRAALKILEAAQWAQIPFQADQVAVEFGASPGGACFALLQLGLRVVGVDPKKMDDVVLKSKNFTYIPKIFEKVQREELPREVHWILLDVNLSPGITFPEVSRWIRQLQKTLLGVVLTIKITDWKWADQIPAITEEIKRLGFSKTQARQLAWGGREVCVVGLRE